MSSAQSFDKWLDGLTDHVAKKLDAKERAFKRKADLYGCMTCEDTGFTLGHVCYGSKPIEVTIHCPDCGPEFLRGQTAEFY